MTSAAVSTAAIYARLSNDKRKGTDDEGRTVAEQIADCRAFIERKGWAPGEIYSDNDISATSGAVRPAFERMLKAAPPVVVAYRASRLSRDVMDTLRLKTAGITGYLEDGGMLDFSSGDATMLTLIRSVVDSADGQKKAEFQKRRNLSDAKAGKWHYARPQFGNDHKTGKLVPKEARAIREAAKALVEGESFWYVAKNWNAQGLRTPKSKNVGGKEWEPGTVRNFFTAPRLIGKRVYEGETYEMQGWEPVLEEKVWKDIQDLIESQKTGKTGKSLKASNMHLLTGIARCGVENCGKGMNIGYRGNADSPRYYKCTTPGHTGRTAEPLEKYVVSTFLYLLIHEDAERALSPEGVKDIATVRAQKRKLEADLEAWTEEANAEGLSAKAIGSRERITAEKVAVLDALILEHQRTNLFADLLPEMVNVADPMGAVWKRWEALDRLKRRSIVEALIKSVTVHRAPQGTRFSGKFVTVKAAPLLLRLVEAIEAQTIELNQEDYEEMLPA